MVLRREQALIQQLTGSLPGLTDRRFLCLSSSKSDCDKLLLYIVEMATHVGMLPSLMAGKSAALTGLMRIDASTGYQSVNGADDAANILVVHKGTRTHSIPEGKHWRIL
jgi:hypothetical protein